MPMSSMNLLPPSPDSVFKMKVADSSEMLVTIYQTVRRHSPENRNLSFDSCETPDVIKYTLLFKNCR